MRQFRKNTNKTAFNFFTRTRVECAGFCNIQPGCYGMRWDELKHECHMISNNNSICLNRKDDPATQIQVYVRTSTTIPICPGNTTANITNAFYNLLCYNM